MTVRARSGRTEHRDRVRARIVLAAAAGCSNAAVAAELGLCVDTARRWRRRFLTGRLEGLADRPRSGRPRRFTAVQVAAITALACTLPAETGIPLSRWSSTELATEAITRGVVSSISASTVRRWLARAAIKPWQHRSWIFPRDPDFETKAARVLDLYARTWEGAPLGPDDYVISADEKSQLQALQRRHPGREPGPGRTRQVEFEYRRGGTLAYLAAYDVHHARVIGSIAPKTGIEPFTDLVEKVMTSEPYASARRVFWIVDNGSSHAGQASIDRMTAAWPTATRVHLPVHASWLTRSRSTSQSCNARPSARSTSPISPHSLSASWHSKIATTAARHRSTGPSPRRICGPCSTGQTRLPRSRHRRPQHHPRRTNELDH